MCSKVLQRLSTFAFWPISSDDLPTPDSNFVSKAAGAHFQRTADCVKDEVKCQTCGVQFSGWNTESPESNGKLYKSPIAVHRVISRECPALNQSGSDENQTQALMSNFMGSPFAKYLPNHLQPGSLTQEQSYQSYVQTERASVRRENGQEDNDDRHNPVVAEIPQSIAQSVLKPRVLDHSPFTHPFKPKTGNYDQHFASVRRQTFPHSSTRYQAWAEDGFVYRREQNEVMCVYCGTVLAVNGHRPDAVHRKVCPSCPFVMGIDVGNITQEQEKFIKLVYLKQQAAKKQSDCEIVIKFVHYQSEEERQLTFQDWPKVYAQIFPAAIMASAGFFFTGYCDKVVCYCCGVELYGWQDGADVWMTHATVSPTCLHVINAKGQDFIAQATSLQVQAEVKYPKDSISGEVSSSGGVVGEEPGIAMLDMTALKAALACRFPNEAILKATLKAADENSFTICRQQQLVLQQETELKEKDTQLQEKDTQLQEKDTQLQEKDTQLQRAVQEKDTQLQEKDTQLQRAVQEKDQTVQTLQSQLSEKDELLSGKDELLSEKEAQLRLQDQQIQVLMKQVQQLRADHHNRNRAPQDVVGNEDKSHSLVCNICQSNKPRMIFLPCGHVFSCAQCTSRLPDKRCPVCRQDISEVLPAFLV